MTITDYDKRASDEQQQRSDNRRSSVAARTVVAVDDNGNERQRTPRPQAPTTHRSPPNSFISTTQRR